jgi:PAS domain S-box-containing protein
MERRDFKKRRLFIQCLSIAVGILLSIVAFWYAKDRADLHFIERFNAIAEIRTSILTANLSYSLEYVEIIGSYYDLSGQISRKDFDRFASPHIINDKCILAFEWVPAVPDALRHVYEEKARKEGLGYFRIWEYDSHGNAIPAESRETYYPLYFKYPGDYSRQLLGLDIGANPESRKLLEEARDSGETLATRPFVPVEFKNRKYAFLVVKPVYNQSMASDTVQEKRKSLKGFIVGVFGAANIVESAIRNTPQMNMPFDIYDISVPEGYMLLHHSKPRKGPEKWNSFLSVFYPDYPHYEKVFQFAGRKYMVSITAGPAYLKNNYSLNYYLILLIGAVLTFFGVFYIRSVLRQREQTTNLIDQRTMELSESRELFRNVFQYSGIGIAMLDTQGNYLEVNRTFSLIVGYSIEELVALNFRAITLADDIEYQNRKMQQILDGMIDTYSMEKRYICKDGGIKWVLMNVSVIRSEDGAPKYFISHLYDITERKRTVEKLIASEARYEQVVSMINDIIWRYEVDAQGGFVSSYISPAADSMLMQPKGTIGNSFEKYFSFVSPEDLPAVRDILSSVLANPEKDVTIEYRMLRPDGAILWFCSNGSAHLQPDGHVVGFGTTTDITKRKQAEIALLEYRDNLEELVSKRTLELEEKNLKLAQEIDEKKRAEDALKESEQRFKSLVENIEGLVWRCLNDENWTALYVSDFMEKLSGYPASDYIGNKKRTLAGDIYPEDAVRVFSEIDEAVKERRSYSIEYRSIRRDGSILWVNERGKGVFDDEGRLLYLDGITLDVTEKKQMEHALAESESRFRTLFESSPTPMWVEDFSLVKKRMDDLDASGINDLRVYLDKNHDEIMNMASMVRVIDINQASLDDLNAGSIEEMAENISMYFTGESIEVFKEELIMLHEGKTAFDCEIPIVNADGKSILYHLYVKVWPGHEDDLSRLMLSFYNITERKHIEQEIRNSQERLRLIIENSNDIFVLIDRKGNQTYISPIVEKLTGYAPEELLHKPFEIVIYPEDLDYVKEAWKKCLENPGVPIRLIYRHIHKEKGYVWFEAIITNYLDNPAVCAIVDNVRDITDRRKTRQNTGFLSITCQTFSGPQTLT